LDCIATVPATGAALILSFIPSVRLSRRLRFVKYFAYRCRPNQLEGQHVTKFGRKALLVIASIAVLLLAIDAAAAETKKHKPIAASPTAVSKSTTRSGAAAKQDSKPVQTDKPSPDQMKSDADPKSANTWTEAEITDAKAHCAAILERIHAVYTFHEPIKHGACGAPAAVELTSIGQNPVVSFSPPPAVRCDLADALDTWLENDVQPLARKHFGSPIVKIETMGDYACRNAYRRKTTKLSEHGLADALDIGAFVTATGKTASVLDGWGTPQREIIARIAAEKAAAAKAAAEKQASDLAAANKSAQQNLRGGKASAIVPPLATASKLGAPAAGLAHSTIDEGVPKLTVTLPGASDKAAIHDEPPPDPEVKAFLLETHEAACHIFGTTLGPEANADHRNHFHVDMAARKYKKICD
jgi:hypothetical protein